MLGFMNDQLAKKKVYGALEHKQVGVWAHVRNKAAHGDWSEFKESDVEAMLRDVPRFLLNHAA
jgi:hypothetical protein